MSTLILYTILAILGILGVCATWAALRRWWLKPYSKPARLYRQLRRLAKISPAEHRAIIEQAQRVSGDGLKLKIDWLHASRLLLDRPPTR